MILCRFLFQNTQSNNNIGLKMVYVKVFKTRNNITDLLLKGKYYLFNKKVFNTLLVL